MQRGSAARFDRFRAWNDRPGRHVERGLPLSAGDCLRPVSAAHSFHNPHRRHRRRRLPVGHAVRQSRACSARPPQLRSSPSRLTQTRAAAEGAAGWRATRPAGGRRSRRRGGHRAARAHGVVVSVLTPAEILTAARRLAGARPHPAAVAGTVHHEDLWQLCRDELGLDVRVDGWDIRGRRMRSPPGAARFLWRARG